jgi:hypothetical protein
MTIELVDCTNTILHEITMGLKRKDIAKTYRLALQSSYPTDWAKVNAAIIERWSRSGLEWIKQQAWSGKALA